MSASSAPAPAHIPERGRHARGTPQPVPAQVLVVSALAIAALLAFAALVVNVGMFLAERRHLQNAADAAALAAGAQLLAQRTALSPRDDGILTAATTAAQWNRVDIGGARQLTASYVDSAGAALASVGSGTVPAQATGVRVGLSGTLATILPFFAGQGGLQAGADATAQVLRVDFTGARVNPAPLGAPLAAFNAGATFDLYDQTVAASQGVSGYLPFLDLASANNGGTGYVAGTDYGAPNVNLQYWADSAHASGTLAVGNRVSLANGAFNADVRAGLLDSVRRQGLVDAGGNSYTLLVVPLWTSYSASNGTVAVAGFATFRLLASNVTTSSLAGTFVAYASEPSGSTRVSGVPWGPSVVALTN